MIWIRRFCLTTLVTKACKAARLPRGWRPWQNSFAGWEPRFLCSSANKNRELPSPAYLIGISDTRVIIFTNYLGLRHNKPIFWSELNGNVQYRKLDNYSSAWWDRLVLGIWLFHCRWLAESSSSFNQSNLTTATTQKWKELPSQGKNNVFKIQHTTDKYITCWSSSHKNLLLCVASIWVANEYSVAHTI